VSVQQPPQWIPPTQPATVPEERSGLSKMMWFGVLQLAGQVVGWGIYAYFFGTFFNAAGRLNLPANPTPAQVSQALGPLFQAIIIVIPVSVAIQVAALATLALAFRDLRKADSPKFSTPSTLIILMVIGLIVTGVAAIPLVASIPSLIAQVPAGTSPATSAAFAAFISTLTIYFAFIGLGLLLFLVGLVGGQLLGLWRAGERYNQTTLKLAAIFAIIPGLSIVAPILVIVGANEAKGHLTKLP
jgi:MFS family permease